MICKLVKSVITALKEKYSFFVRFNSEVNVKRELYGDGKIIPVVGGNLQSKNY
jgi:hypothetical protein